jgi:hypothetical protein
LLRVPPLPSGRGEGDVNIGPVEETAEISQGPEILLHKKIVVITLEDHGSPWVPYSICKRYLGDPYQSGIPTEPNP